MAIYERAGEVKTGTVGAQGCIIKNSHQAMGIFSETFILGYFYFKLATRIVCEVIKLAFATLPGWNGRRGFDCPC